MTLDDADREDCPAIVAAPNVYLVADALTALADATVAAPKAYLVAEAVKALEAAIVTDSE